MSERRARLGARSRSDELLPHLPSPLPRRVAPDGPADAQEDVTRPPLLVPPYYGRSARPSSPDVFNALFHPVLKSLSRPGSPSPASSRIRPLFDASGSPAERAASSLPSQFPPREPTDPAPTVESQGFLLYLSSLVLFAAYLAWSILPPRLLARIGIAWCPSREWALLIPSWITMSIAYTYLAYFFLNLSHTVTPREHIQSLDDPKSWIPPPLWTDAGPDPVSRLYFDSIRLPPEAIPPLYDLPLSEVERVLGP
ncbi:uncharacterized protein JCM15063_000765 [Sporobolomyces koalae]|uniref:uncharacterized protein n=1 Tax=Sporobolomyces koalae TaxID=500713 RepID=UPI00317CA7BE